MLFRWIARRRRRRIRQQPFPPSWLGFLAKNVACYQRLSVEEQAKLRADVSVLVAEKNWEGCGGLEMSDEVRVTIAAHIAILCLGFNEEYFEMMESILVYPDAYTAKGQTQLGGGVILEGPSNREGEAWYRGPVVLSWKDVLKDGRRDNDGHNLVLHEFAHQLDMQNGRVTDGVPPLSSQTLLDRWQEVVNASFQRLCDDCRRGRPTVLDCYGTTNLAEFFAVATECFFERPIRMHREEEALYAVLSEYYHQDPRTRHQVR